MVDESSEEVASYEVSAPAAYQQLFQSWLELAAKFTRLARRRQWPLFAKL